MLEQTNLLLALIMPFVAFFGFHLMDICKQMDRLEKRRYVVRYFRQSGPVALSEHNLLPIRELALLRGIYEATEHSGALGQLIQPISLHNQPQSQVPMSHSRRVSDPVKQPQFRQFRDKRHHDIETPARLR